MNILFHNVIKIIYNSYIYIYIECEFGWPDEVAIKRASSLLPQMIEFRPSTK